MRRILLLCGVVFSSLASYGQIDEGYFQFSIDVEAIDTSMESRRQASMLFDSKMEIYFAKGLARVDFKLGSLTNTSIRINREKNEALTITSGVMGSYANKNTPEGLGVGQVQGDSLFTVTLFDETKTILGFTCKKAVLERKGVRATYWYTNEIVLENIGQQVVNKDIPGFPLAFTSIDNGIRMHYQASNYKFSIDNKEEVFATDPPASFVMMQNQGE